MKVFNLRRTVGMALLGAIAFVLMFVEFPIIPIAPFLKIDFSDIPVLLGLVIYGPWEAVGITFLKCLIHALVYGMSLPELIGVSSSFIASCALIFPFYFALKKKNGSQRSKFILGIILGTLSLTIIESLLDWLVVLPLYMDVLGMKLTISLPSLVMMGVVPFNLIKGILIGVVFWIIAGRMRGWLSKQV
ncbi:integral membrane protein [Paucilactobacillus suebicus DSM 5007 = KCTC 3549]|uniref:Riboflavin transporter n=1 Tax=Paucilactobacillus suebicus DSM 5007 = KCTC 3549 TaxID=1423807 RepID=A0A0R1WDA6_9LACO|nr:integral membrane protein [Paucilactobacillus suebicus DSM 5007 = KCTC 3549]